MTHSTTSQEPASQKIAVFGPPFAGKTTLVRAYSEAHHTVATSAGDGRGNTPGAEPRLFCAKDTQTGLRIVTFAGIVFEFRDWEEMLLACDVVLVVVDAQGERLQENFEYLAYLRHVQSLRPSLKGCFALSKTDLASALSSIDICRSLAINEDSFPGWPVFLSNDKSVDTLLAPFNFLTKGDSFS